MGRAAAACGLDSSKDGAQHCHVRSGLDAHIVSARADGSEFPRTCCVVNVSRLLQELILHACQFPAMNRRVKAHAHLIDLILDQLETVRAIPLQLTSPVDPRALRVAAILQRDPSESRSLAALCREVGAARERLRECLRGKQACRWASGDSNCELCILCSNWLPEKRLPAPLWMRATALPAHSSRCFEKRWEPRHDSTLRTVRRGLGIAEVDHHRSRAEPVRLVADVEDSHGKPDSADRFGNDIEVDPD